MRLVPVDHTGESRLRFFFDDAVVSFSVSRDVTFGDIAGLLDELPNPRFGNPRAIDITTIPQLLPSGGESLVAV